MVNYKILKLFNVSTFTLLSVLMNLCMQNSLTDKPITAPANGAIHRTTKLVDGFQKDSIYAGYPNDESDAAWHDLLASQYPSSLFRLSEIHHPSDKNKIDINLRISPEELAKLNQTSIALKDGGYLGTLGVYHELHCVVRNRGPPPLKSPRLFPSASSNAS